MTFTPVVHIYRIRSYGVNATLTIFVLLQFWEPFRFAYLQKFTWNNTHKINQYIPPVNSPSFWEACHISTNLVIKREQKMLILNYVLKNLQVYSQLYQCFKSWLTIFNIPYIMAVLISMLRRPVSGNRRELIYDTSCKSLSTSVILWLVILNSVISLLKLTDWKKKSK